MKYLFIAEKPSVMREVESCYRKHKAEIKQAVGSIDFVALLGHVCTYYEPSDYDEWGGELKWGDIDYPMIPTNWKIKMIQENYRIRTVNGIKSVVHNYDGIIVGTDSDVEGYGIYHLLENFLEIQTMPALRFIEHSLTDSEILKSLLTMTDYHTDPVHIHAVQSFLLRSRADWLYGMNATRMMTLKTQYLIAIGRVKSPTIKLVYDNSMAIENFKPVTYFQVQADYKEGFSAVLLDDEKKPRKFCSKDETRLNVPLRGIVQNKEEKENQVHSPKLYDLSAIQSEAGQMFGLTPSDTLAIIQSLYEKHKVISYPRTQCRYVTTEKAKEFPAMLEKIKIFDDLAGIVDGITSEDISRVYKDKEVVNDKEVEKESHDALLPTSNTPDLSQMSEMEIKICKLIYKRLLAQFLPKLKEKKTNLYIKHGEYFFYANGKTIARQGWRILYGELKDNDIPDLSEGQAVIIDKVGPISKTTTPPKRLTQSTLLSAMENIANKIEDKELRASLTNSKGIGTPTTRASIIKDIIEKGYVRDKRGLYITNLGKVYIENLEGIDIISPTFAAILDTDIKKIQRGEASYEETYSNVITDLKQMCSQIESMESRIPTVNYACPICGEKLLDRQFDYKCKNENCSFKIPKLIAGKHITENTLEELYSDIKQPKYTFKKKDGSTFKARLKLTEKGLEFDFSSGLTCPYCGEMVRENKAGYFCDCGLKIFNPCFGKKLTEANIATLLTYGKLPKMSGFKSKDGEAYAASLILENGIPKCVY